MMGASNLDLPGPAEVLIFATKVIARITFAEDSRTGLARLAARNHALFGLSQSNALRVEIARSANRGENVDVQTFD
jgi:hypothetical protein